MGRSVLITGGTGFLGHGLVSTFLNKDHAVDRIRVYSRGEHTQARMRETFRDDRLGFFIGDVRDVDRLERAMHHVSVVIHAAALKRVEVGYYNPDEMTKTNVIGTMNVIEAARRAGVQKVVFVSSDKAFQPVSPYGLSKAMGESLCIAGNRMSLGPRFAVCRYGNVSGSTGSVIPRWREIIAQDRELHITDPDCTRFWMLREQAVALVISALDGASEMLIPQLPAYRLGDLAEAMGARKTKIIGLDQWEKRHESMDHGNCSAHAKRLTIDELRSALASLYHERLAA